MKAIGFFVMELELCLHYNDRFNFTNSCGTINNQWSDPVECECVGAGHARPYNEGRNKSRTR